MKSTYHCVIISWCHQLTFVLHIADISRLSNEMMLQPDQDLLSTNLFFKLDVSLPLVTGERLQNTVDVTK